MPFCTSCGTEVPAGVNFCGKCGKPMSGGRSPAPRPSQPQPQVRARPHPQSNYAYRPPVDDAPAAWNPVGVAWIGFFLLPLGLVLYHLNWKSLGRGDRQASSIGWMVAGIVLYALPLLLAMSMNITAFYVGSALQVACFVFFIVWYFAGGCREQAFYVNYELMGRYRRKPWGAPLLVLFGFWIVWGIILTALIFSAFSVMLADSGLLQFFQWLEALE